MPKRISLLLGSSVVHSRMAVSWVLDDTVGPVSITGNWVSGSLLVVKLPAPPTGCSTLTTFPVVAAEGSKVPTCPLAAVNSIRNW